MKDVPEVFLRDKAFQDVLVERFEGTDKYEKMVNAFAKIGVLVEKPLLERLKDAEERAGVEKRETGREQEAEMR